jgi:arylsulfatase A-like enzyme
MTKLLKYLTLSTVCIIALSLSKRERPPNVVLIMTDDQGWGDLSIHGNPYLETPNLDNLARQSTRFDCFYVSPLCAPTRASLLTGRYHLRTGTIAVSKGLEIMDTEETTLAELFKANGYKTGIFGKWHNGQHYPNHPNNQGFETFFGFCGGHWSNYFDTQLERNGKMEATKGFITDVLTDAALDFIGKNKQKAFFCYIPYNAPHSPHQTPDKYFDKYKNKGLNDELASIYGMVENIDDNIGRVLNYLKINNLEDNTIVIFLTDNGPNGVRFNGGMKGTKSSVNEGGIRVPFFIKWKSSIAENKLIKTAAVHIDLYPTLLELCRLKAIPTRPQDGVSLAQLILNDKPLPDRPIFTHVNFSTTPVLPLPASVRYKNYRLVMDKGQTELYDLDKDPSQKVNIYAQNTEGGKKLENGYKTWFAAATKELRYERITVLTQKGVELPTYEATLTEGIHYKEGHGWVHDWAAKWTNDKDSLFWDIDCEIAAKYSFSINYICPKANISAQLSINNAVHSLIIKQPFTAQSIPSPDRIPRKEVYEMSHWGQQNLGIFKLKKGRNRIVLKTQNGNNPLDFEVKSIEIRSK